eukprot:COSAG02_NODE_3529_length_6610_cov_40.548610_4_plen_35_part_00
MKSLMSRGGIARVASIASKQLPESQQQERAHNVD